MSPLKIARYLLYVSLALGLAAVAREVTPLYTLLTLISLAASVAMEERGVPHLPNLPVTLGAILLILLNLKGLTLQVFFNRVMAILFVLISAKLLTKKKVRDYLQLYLLSLLLIAGAAVVRWGMEFGLLLAANIFLLLSGLVFLFASTERETISSREAQTLFLWGGTMSMALLPATALFFLILPRPSFTFTPGWAGGKTARSGFGEKISPGKVESIKRDLSVVMRVEWLQGARPPSNLLYWRGKIYESYRLGTWEAPRITRQLPHPPIPRGQEVAYRVFLEPQESSTLFVLGIPIRAKLIKNHPILGPGYTLKAPFLVTRRITYTLRSRLVSSYPALLPPSRFLGVPPPIAHRLRKLAMSIAPGEKDPLKIAEAVEEFLKKNYRYTLHPKNRGPYPVVSFLLQRGAGHCEYFATSMVLLLRIRGVPARMVAGFLGGEWNRLGHYYIVRNSHAHTWVEVYKAGKGWITFDPTPPLPPGTARNLERLSSLGRLLDYLRFQWYHWVISYDVERQTRLLKKALSLFSPSTPKPRLSPSRLPFKTLALLASLVLGLFLFLRFIQWWQKRPQTWGERLTRLLQDAGYPPHPGETLLEMAHRISTEHPHLGEKIEKAVELYYWKEYGGGDVSPDTLEEALKEIRSALRKKSSSSQP